MPTVGWILEGAEDRFWESTSSTPLWHVEAQKYACPYCDSEFESEGDKSSHVSVDHPIARPLIFIDNRFASSEQVLQSPINAAAIDIVNTKMIYASKNGARYERWTPSQLRENLATTGNMHLEIKLTNGDDSVGRLVTARYVFRIRYARPEDLNSVDKKFTESLAIEQVCMSDVRNFVDRCQSYHSASDYSSALAEYVVGILVKDQNSDTGISLPFAKYKEKLQHAIVTLRNFDRPIANAVCNAIRLNLNNFDTVCRSSGVEALDAAMTFFFKIQANRLSIQNEKPAIQSCEKELPACPIDRDSSHVLRILGDLRGKRIESSTLENLIHLSSSRTLSDPDRSKMQVMATIAAMQAGRLDLGEQLIETLANDPDFGRWADSQLNT